MTQEIFSVSQYLDRVNILLKSEKLKIVGEVYDLKMSETWTFTYFSLKDKKDGSVLHCIIGKNDYRISGVTLFDGVEIIVTGYSGVYKPKGELKLRAEIVELVGEGVLKLAYEKLRKKLEAEGFFAEERKREIPLYPHRIGVITSKNGAVINDFLSNIGKFGFEILFVDSKVEGQDATKDLLSALKTLAKKDLDVLVIMRGGGSLESFLAFNNEILVREVAGFPVPVLTGIGHDKDVPLMSLVSDKNVSTPTAVANLLNFSWNEAMSSVRLSEQKMFSSLEHSLKDRKFFIENGAVVIEKRFNAIFQNFKEARQIFLQALVRINSEIKRMNDLVFQRGKEVVRGFFLLADNAENFLKQASKSIEGGNPKNQLAKGYSIVKNKGKVLRRVKDAKKGDDLDILVSDGTIVSKVA